MKNSTILMLGAAGFATLLLWTTAANAARDMKRVKVIEIVTGDTIVVLDVPDSVHGSAKANKAYLKVVKLYGVEAPDVSEDVGKQAYEFLKDEVLKKRVTVRIEDRKSDDPVIGKVKAPGMRDVGEEMVERGLVRRHNDDGEYEKAEEKAQKKKRGVWAADAEDEGPEGPVTPRSAIGKFYKLRISGYDTWYRFGDSPNRFLVYQKRKGGTLVRRFILAGIDPRRLDKLRPSDSEDVYVQLIKDESIKFADGSVKSFPVLKVVGKSRVYGVGGELMYYK